MRDLIRALVGPGTDGGLTVSRWLSYLTGSGWIDSPVSRILSTSFGPPLATPAAVECRIQVVHDDVTVAVAGQLEHVHVADLNRLCSEAPGPVVVDMSDLLSVDSIAVDALRRLRQKGVTIVGAPRYLQFALSDPS